MVCGKYQHLRIMKTRPERVLHQTQAQRERFEFAQAARGFAAALQLFSQCPFQRRVGRRRNK
jgi:hypothetical protein